MGKLTNRKFLLAVLTVALLVVGLAACGDDDSDSTSSDTTAGSDTTAAASGDLSGTIRLGVFANVTHAPGLVGIQEGFFADALGEGVDLEVQSFDSGTSASEALYAGSLDITYIGPNPAINGWSQFPKDAYLVSGSTSGGAALVVSKEISTLADLAGKTIATPSLGNTQDVALRYWLSQEGYETTPEGGGDVAIQPQDNSQTLDLFTAGEIDGAWVPEPWATRLVNEGGGKVLVDEADLWPDGRFVTTHLLASSDFITDHADLLEAFLAGHVEAVDFANDKPAEAQAAVVAQIKDITGQNVDAATIETAWKNLEFTVDPIATSLQASADHAEEVGLLESVDLEGIYDLSVLNKVLAEAGKSEVKASLT